MNFVNKIEETEQQVMSSDRLKKKKIKLIVKVLSNEN
jgi:hypothetical protein